MKPPVATACRIAGTTVLILGLAVNARADLRSCTASDPGMKVLLDDIVDASGAASPLMLPLRFRLEANLQKLKAEAGLQLTVVRCPNRQPQQPSDFRKSLVDDLNAHQVVLELWGTTMMTTDNTGAQVHDAYIGYVLVPVHFYEFDSGNPPGVFLVARRAQNIASVDDLLKLVDPGTELPAYAALAAGTRALKAGEYDLARKQLCKAEALLKLSAQARPDPTLEALQNYAAQKAGEVVARVRADPRGSNGVLASLPFNTSGGCSAGVTP
jgi:hypothetical protein